MKKAIVVLGYNNTRIDDVSKIRDKAKQHANAMTILCKKNLTEADRSVVDFAIDVGLEQSQANVNIVLHECLKRDIDIIGVLPFSDQGTQLGALLAHTLHLPGFDPLKIRAALDKSVFRQQESSLSRPSGYQPVTSRRIQGLQELQGAFLEVKTGLFIKPIAEGNSRGCIAIKNYEECEQVWEEVKPYLSGGITVESLIQNAREYSWDHVAGYSWLTEKKTTQTQYRAEPQHIVPAPLNMAEQDLLASGARFMGEISGFNGGACHNEIFLSEKGDTVMGVEPNLRPAGAKIWDLAAYAFEDFDPWASWILWAIGNSVPSRKFLKQKKFAGLRFITAPRAGVLHSFSAPALKELSSMAFHGIVEFVWTKKVGDSVKSIAKDNSDFMGYIIAVHENYDILSKVLLDAERFVVKGCVIL